ncbi:ABC transporter ATP-binding protein [Aureimonas phyllosphaerae]|uniref:ABC transporter ATP-binding protein n=1 Tax=Aureimonas phyllosphaerae TaxID=1166078 RepID=UPI003A5BC833
MNSLELRGVAKDYSVDGVPVPVLRGVDLTVGAGEIVAILGASGCGKSTLLRLIAGLDRDYAGSVRAEGREVTGPDTDRGLVFQDHRLFPWLTAAENVDLALDSLCLDAAARQERVRHHLDLVGLSDFARAYPRQLSGGMAQRAAIARALVTEPRIILMDEPFGALDSFLRMRLQEELLRIWERRGVSIVIVTHDIEEALFLADRVVVMDARPGRVVETLSVDEFRPRDRNGSGLVELKRYLLSLLAAKH